MACPPSPGAETKYLYCRVCWAPLLVASDPAPRAKAHCGALDRWPARARPKLPLRGRHPRSGADRPPAKLFSTHRTTPQHQPPRARPTRLQAALFIHEACRVVTSRKSRTHGGGVQATSARAKPPAPLSSRGPVSDPAAYTHTRGRQPQPPRSKSSPPPLSLASLLARDRRRRRARRSPRFPPVDRRLDQLHAHPILVGNGK